ncbi:TolC family protein [Nitrospirillum viridazoti]|uniref:TolC family protein n=1 Tax=Nitrospirillum viridazoti TaxID=3144925 RepID=UPI0011A5D96D|nr:TolC family protein [Nitrospirillum amazonense]TWB40976.1 cobalt-zinc-cadmium efflux system outer membrane protein [Nitrospirillum amazonense]
MPRPPSFPPIARRRRAVLASAALAASLGLAPAFAATPDPAPTAGSIHALFLQALERDPTQQALGARLAAADASQNHADGLFPVPPRVQAYNLTDRVARNRGWQEAEVQLALPIWLPGESGALARKADAERQVASSTAQRQALTVAGAVRAAAWDLALARRLEALAQDRLNLAMRLEADMEREVARGGAARLDLSLLQAERANAAANLEARRGVTALAREALTALTDNGDIAGDLAETGAEEATGSDPRLEAARAGERLAQETASVSRVADREHPEVGVIYRHNRDTFGGPPSDYVGLQVTVPFSGPSYTARTRTAEADLRQATAERVMVERTVTAGARQAQAALTHARAQLAAETQRQAAAADRAGKMQRARALGEAATSEMVRAQQSLNDANTALAEAEVRLGRAQSDLLQARGVLP